MFSSLDFFFGPQIVQDFGVAGTQVVIAAMSSKFFFNTDECIIRLLHVQFVVCIKDQSK